MPGPSVESARALLERRLLRLWFGDPGDPANRRLAALLSPLAALTGLAAARRRALIRRLPAAHRPAVVVIGNLVAGGTGKTPAVIALAEALSRRGLRVGLLARGYLGARRDARIVAADADATEHGDEAVLLARATGLPVAAGARRDAALALLADRHPALDVAISDDGLQHRWLARTIEVAVFDARGVGNARLLPAGPLREPLAHVQRMDAVLLNGDAQLPQALGPPAADGRLPAFRFHVEPTGFRRLRERSHATGVGATGVGATGVGATGAGSTGAGATGAGSTGAGSTGAGSTGAGATGAGATGAGATGAGATGAAATGAAANGTPAPQAELAGDELTPEAFVRLAAGRSVDALAGIAEPQRFFATLRRFGLQIREHPLPDHARITPATLAALAAPLVAMTAKDAVKCRSFADERCWELGVRARIEPGFVDWLEERLRGPSTA